MNLSKPVPPYRGRFAPTPSGPLHLGSLLTALASWLSARVVGGAWLLRIDDLDQARCPSGMDSMILSQLEAHGLVWDERPRRQSEHIGDYEAVLHDLQQRGLTYACRCTRAVLAETSRLGIDGPVYAGFCRGLDLSPQTGSLRIRLPAQRLLLTDPIQGRLQRDAASEVGDFILRRSDRQIGYQLACVIDEAAQGITEVVRGADLIGSTFRQRLLQDMLGMPSPDYLHLPVLLAADGRKLSKQNGAPPLDPAQAGNNLLICLQALHQEPPADCKDVSALLGWALTRWSRDKVPRIDALGIEARRA